MNKNRQKELSESTDTVPLIVRGIDHIGITVPDMDAKLMAQAAGLGVGFLPRWLAEQAARDGRVRICAVEAPNPPAPAHYAWREHRPGKALSWFLTQLADSQVLARLLGETA